MIFSVIVNYNTSSPSRKYLFGVIAMKAFLIRYLNEIVGLTVMALMTLALVAGQADAEIHKVAVEEARQVIEIRLTVAD
jgi:hypothetical protein